MQTNGRLRLLRQNNIAQVALAVHRHGPVSRVQIARITGLSVPCISSIVDELLEGGVLAEVGAVTGAKGRPKVLLDIDPDGAPVVGVYLAVDATQIVTANPRGEVLAQASVPYHEDHDEPEVIFPEIVDGIRRCVAASGRELESVSAIGVSVAGLGNLRTGVIDVMLNRPAWGGFPLARRLHEALGVRAFIDNDIRAAATSAEWRRDASRGGTALYVSITEGIGGAIVHGRSVLRGEHDAAAVLGAMVIEPDGPPYDYGNRGCLEALATDVAFIRRVWPEMEGVNTRMSAGERARLVREAMDLAAAGDTSAASALAVTTRYLGIAIANCVTMIDPQSVFVLGTMVDAAPEMVIDMIREHSLLGVPGQAQDVRIEPIVNLGEFLLQGCIGLALWRPYRMLQEQNDNAMSV